MNNRRNLRLGSALVLVLTSIAAAVALVLGLPGFGRTHIVAYFDNTNGMFKGDEVRVLGVPVGSIDSIEPQPDRVKVSFWVDDQYKVPADAKAVILSPQLITSRAIQLTPAYTGGPAMKDGAVIPQNRTAVPLEWDDLRAQLEKLTDALQPTKPGGVSTLGAFVDTAADNLRDNGASIREAIIKLSEAFSIVGDHSGDTFASIKNVSVVVSALKDSTTVLRQLNQNLATVTTLLDDDPGAVGRAVKDLNTVVNQATSFIAENREPLGATTDKLSSISQAVAESIPDIKESLHIFPTAFQNLLNIYRPAQGAIAGEFAIPNFNNPIEFICGAIEAAGRLNAKQSAKLCAQYLAPILKNRQYNFLPLGENLFLSSMARPNEITYSEDWMRPDYVPPQAAPASNAVPQPAPPPSSPVSTNPAAGLSGMMVPQGGGR